MRLVLVLLCLTGPFLADLLATPHISGGCGRAWSFRYGAAIQCEHSASSERSSNTSRGSSIKQSSSGRGGQPRVVPRITRVATAITGTNRVGCEVAQGTVSPSVICSTTPRPGSGMPQPVVPAISSEAAAYRAIAVLDLTVPVPHVGPDPDGLEWGFVPVGYPVWLWTTGGTTGSQTATTTVEGITVSMRHEAPQLTWNMGDDEAPFTCRVDAPAYVSSADGSATESGVCGYRYQRMGRFVPSVTASWTIHWSAGPDSGVITETLTRSLGEIAVGELHAVVTQRGD